MYCLKNELAYFATVVSYTHKKVHEIDTRRQKTKTPDQELKTAKMG
jgi:hypothetical protein